MRSTSRPRGMRVAQLSIVAVSLALPASAFGLSQTTSRADAFAPRSLPTHPAPRRVRLGQRVTLSGRARSGQRVVLEVATAPRGAWHALSGTRSGRRGGFALHARLRRSTLLRAVELAPPSRSNPLAHAAAFPGGAGLTAARERAAAISRVSRVEVAARVQLARRTRTAVAGGRLHLAGHLLPGRSGRRISLQSRVGRGWRTVAHARTGGRGGFSVAWLPPTAADRYLRVVFAGDRSNGRATAAAGPVDLFSPIVASWYVDTGSNACGFHAGLGIANKTLPCGTKVTFEHAGRTVTATVDDRGPYVYGRDYDFAEPTAAALGFAGVGTVLAHVG